MKGEDRSRPVPVRRCLCCSPCIVIVQHCPNNTYSRLGAQWARHGTARRGAARHGAAVLRTAPAHRQLALHSCCCPAPARCSFRLRCRRTAPTHRQLRSLQSRAGPPRAARAPDEQQTCGDWRCFCWLSASQVSRVIRAAALEGNARTPTGCRQSWAWHHGGNTQALVSDSSVCFGAFVLHHYAAIL